MKTVVYLHIAFRIIVLVLIGMALTYIPEHLRTFFGDIPSSKGYISDFNIDTNWYWGVRHYWYFWGVVLLFLLTLINFIWSLVNIIDKHYPVRR